jgi:hypothetical protein
MTDRAVFPLPLELDEIDAAWLTAALRTRAPGVTVRGCEVVDMKRGTCTKVRFKLTYDEAGLAAGLPTTVILKGGFEPHSRISRAMSSMHEMEVGGYREILPTTGLPSPRCYFAEWEPAREQGIVILEDLVASGATFCDPRQGQSREAITMRLSELAKFHAQTWDSPWFKPGGKWSWLYDVTAMTREYAGPYLTEEIWARFVGSPRGAAVSTRFHDREWMIDALDKMANLAARTPHCVLHSDTHVGNTYVAADGTPGFYDSLSTHGPSLLEITYNLVCAMDVADRPEWERPLMQHYLGELGRHGIDAPGLDEAMRQYGIYLARAYFIFLVNDAVFQDEAVNTAYTARIGAAMLAHDTKGLLKSVT